MQSVQHGVMAPLRQQRFMGTTLDQTAFFQNQNAIRHADGREAVRDQHGGAAHRRLFKPIEEFILSAGIEAGARFIQNEQPRIGAGQATGQGQLLPLSTGEVALAEMPAQQRLIALGQMRNEILSVR